MKILMTILFAICLAYCVTATGSEHEYKNTLKWSTASEVDNFGYDIYRSTREDGPFTRVTENMIEGAGTTDLISQYQFTDRNIDPHKTYYYYIESISVDGKRRRFSPLKKAGPKLKAENTPN